MDKLMNRNSRGFTILELMISMAIFLILSGAILGGMARLQANYRTAEVSTAMQQQLRSTMELMAQEIGQAGLQASTFEGASTDGDLAASTYAPYSFPTGFGGGAQTAITMSPNSTAGVFAAYVGQWLQVDGGVNQDAIQISKIYPATNQIDAIFNYPHAGGTVAYPMGVFPHGIVSDQSVSSVTGSKLAMFGEISGSGNGLFAVEYACPNAFPGSLTRTVWKLSDNPPTPTTSNLIDNVTTCYFCWPGTTGSGLPGGTGNPNCPPLAATAAPQTVKLNTGSTTPPLTATYSMITQVGFTITAAENVTISGSTQAVTITKSYSNIQPRNIITANNIYNAAVSSATTAANGTTFSNYLYGELQPDPPKLGSVTW
jgi:prepilin-type N-terminal cleavage/methylation domain-containing protein